MKSPYWALVPAAGSGQRFGAETPKQYQVLLGKTVLEWTLSALLNSRVFSSIVVVLDPQDQVFVQLPVAQHPLVTYCFGGANRAQSVNNGLKFLKSLADDEDWVFVHDVARPCVSIADITALIEFCDHSGDCDGAVLGAPIVDSIKQVDERQCVIQSADRSIYWRAFTPQVARYRALKQALDVAKIQKVRVNDEAEALLLLQKKVKMIAGSIQNIKLTYPEDLDVIRSHLQHRLNRKE